MFALWRVLIPKPAFFLDGRNDVSSLVGKENGEIAHRRPYGRTTSPGVIAFTSTIQLSVWVVHVADLHDWR